MASALGPTARKMAARQITTSTSNAPTSGFDSVPLILTLVIVWALVGGAGSGSALSPVPTIPN